MSRLRFYQMVVVGAVLGLITQVITLQSSIFAVPVLPLAQFLRKLSLSSSLGNAIAIILYLLIGLSPILWRLSRRRKWDKLDGLVILLSGVLLWGIYRLINPLQGDAGDILPFLGSGINISILSLILIYLSVGVLKRVDHSPFEKVLDVGMWLLAISSAVGAYIITGPLLRELIVNLATTSSSGPNVMTGPPNLQLFMDQLYTSKAFQVIRFGIVALNYLLLILLSDKVIPVIQALKSDITSDSAGVAIADLIRLAKRSLIIMLAVHAGYNLLLLAFRSFIFHKDFNLHIPVSFLFILIGTIVITTLLQRYRDLKLDNEYIV